MALNYTPRGYMWVLTYRDGRAVAQFDPETGKENKLFNVKRDNVERIGLYPIKLPMALKILQGEGIITIPNDNPPYEIELEEGQKPYYRANTRVPTGQYHICLECGAKWIFSFGGEDPYVRRKGFPWASDHKIFCVTCISEGRNTELSYEDGKWVCPRVDEHRSKNAIIRRYRVAVCPNCGYHNIPTEGKEKMRIIQQVADMSYLLYHIGAEDGNITTINEWGEVIT